MRPTRSPARRQNRPKRSRRGAGRPVRRRPVHDAILEKRAKRLTAQRIWQDLTEEFGYGHSYESVKRYLRRWRPRARRRRLRK